MIVRFWGTRGSLATPGHDTARYGGNTSCVQITGPRGGVLILDAGTGIRALGRDLPPSPRRLDILLTHLHMDHIQGLGFFSALFDADREVHIWGPATSDLDLRRRLVRYLSAPLFPVLLRDLDCRLVLHALADTPAEIGEFHITPAFICHPGPTLGYRITTSDRTVAYLPDHEPALGRDEVRNAAEWTSGTGLAHGADLLIHDAQYSDDQYAARVGWGHSTLRHAIQFANLCGVSRLITFHHDPSHDDTTIERLHAEAIALLRPALPLAPAAEGQTLRL